MLRKTFGVWGLEFGVEGRIAPGVLLAIVGGVALIAVLGVQVQQLQTKLTNTKQTLAQRTQDNEALTTQLQDLQRERNQLEERLTGLRSQLERSTEELTTVRQSLTQLQTQAEATAQERAQLNSERARLEQEQVGIQQRVDELTRTNDGLSRAVGDLRSRLKLADRDYHQLKARVSQGQSGGPTNALTLPGPDGTPLSSSTPGGGFPLISAQPSPAAHTIELPPIIVRKSLSMMAEPIRGSLVQISEPHNFVIVDRGTEAGVQVGMVFDIIRGSTPVGQAKVTRVRPRLSACEMIRTATTGPLYVGDAAVQRQP